MVRVWFFTRLFVILLLIFFVSSVEAKKTKIKQTSVRLIILSIDGFPGYYFESPEILDQIPHIKEFSQKSSFSSTVDSVDPSVTYPSHTSMITGVNPGVHGIFNNTPLDPFEFNDGGWMWYSEDIKVPTLWDLAQKQKKVTANVFWPVTVGATIDYNLPQYWRKKITEDNKILRALSTPGLHRLAEKSVGEVLSDTTKDQIKFKTATWLYHNYNPDLMFVYTTDLDSYHHAYGPHSEKAIEKLKEIDASFGEFIKNIKLYEDKKIALILISDHGFASATKTCSPNLYLLKEGFIQAETHTFDFIFKSSGGSALLLPGKRQPTDAEINKIKLDLESLCPGIQMDTLITNIDLKAQHPEAIAWIYSKEGIYFSGSRKGEIFSENKSLLYGHGFNKSDLRMKTIGGFYWKGMRDKEAWKIHSVKDVFNLSCNLLNLECN